MLGEAPAELPIRGSFSAKSIFNPGEQLPEAWAPKDLPTRNISLGIAAFCLIITLFFRAEVRLEAHLGDPLWFRALAVVILSTNLRRSFSGGFGVMWFLKMNHKAARVQPWVLTELGELKSNILFQRAGLARP